MSGAPGAVTVAKDPERGGYVARQRWWHDGQPYRSQAWGRTQTEAKKALAATIEAKADAIDAAVARAEQEEAADLRGIPLNCDLDGIVARWLAWREEYERLSPSTLDALRGCWRARLSKAKPRGSKKVLGKIGIDDLTVGHLTNLLAAVVKEGVQVKQQHVVLRGALTWAFRQGARIDGIDMSQYVPKAPTVPGREQRAMAEAEHLTLVGLAEEAVWHHRRGLEDLRDALVCEWHLGIRIGELLALRLDDFVLDDEVPRVRVAATIVRAKGGERRMERRKHGAAPFWLRCSLEVVAIVERRRSRKWCNSDDDFLFAVKESGRHVQAGNLRRVLRRLIVEQPDRSLDGLSWHAYKRAMATDSEEAFSASGLAAAAEMTGTGESIVRRHYVKVRGLRVLDPTAFRVTGTAAEDSD